MDMQKNPFGAVIYAYTRKQAIKDGVLVDVSETAREAGIKFPTVVTDTLWAEWVMPSEEMESLGQSMEGRLWDVLWMLRCKAKDCSGPVVKFEVYFLTPGKNGPNHVLVELKAICGPGDDAEPVVTLMLPHED